MKSLKKKKTDNGNDEEAYTENYDEEAYTENYDEEAYTENYDDYDEENY